MNYKESLNILKTNFEMKANLNKKEPSIQKFWDENSIYQKVLSQNKDNKQWILHDGPPYANGDIHVGHSLNKTIKDIIVRQKSLKGFYSPYIPGWDTHGLPIEHALLKKGINKDPSLSVADKRKNCREFAINNVNRQLEQFKRLGLLTDWKDKYLTLTTDFEVRQLELFLAIVNKGLIYQDLKPIYWSWSSHTALAEAEIEYKDVNSNTAYVKFPVRDSKGLFDVKGTFVVIWTTTPWTLPGNMGITIGADFKYAIVDIGKEKLIMATDLVSKVMEKAEIEEYKIVKEFEGKELEGVICKHPFFDRDSRIVLGSDDTILVELETGTGAVHTAPGYGKEDYLCGLKNNLEIVVTVDSKGVQRGEEAGPFKDMYYAKSDKEIIKWLDENGLLLASEKVNHSYPHCWRCKNPVIFRATNQWFASVDRFRKETLEAIKTVKWYPAWGEERITKMVEDRNDWCISRQRTWGVPIPVFYCKDCEKEYVTDESLEKVQKIFKEKGSNAWFELSEKELMPEGAKCSKCGCTEFKKETDIMDVWFDSGSTHESVLAERGLPPANLYLEGSDQYRGWFQSSILTSVATKGVAPYKEVITHGYTVDEQGRKMSKSLGNGIAPQDVIKESGADVLRLWVLSSDYKSDISGSKNIIKQVTEVYRKIRNTARYILGNISDFDVSKPVAYEE